MQDQKQASFIRRVVARLCNAFRIKILAQSFEGSMSACPSSSRTPGMANSVPAPALWGHRFAAFRQLLAGAPASRTHHHFHETRQPVGSSVQTLGKSFKAIMECIREKLTPELKEGGNCGPIFEVKIYRLDKKEMMKCEKWNYLCSNFQSILWRAPREQGWIGCLTLFSVNQSEPGLTKRIRPPGLTMANQN